MVSHGIGRLCAAGAFAAGFAVLPLAGAHVHAAHAASNGLQSLVARAERDTNTVKTLVHKDTIESTTATLAVKVSAQGTEDEVHNREHDVETVSVKSHPANGKPQSAHYTVDIIFMNGKTYYRASFLQNKWLSKSGMSFQAPGSPKWQRGRTKVSFGKADEFQVLGKYSLVSRVAGKTEVKANVKRVDAAGTVRLWISSGEKPYVVREVLDTHSTKGAKVVNHDDSTFGPFDKPQVIVSPSTGGSA